MDPSFRFVDLSHHVCHGMVTYPGLPAPEISQYWTREDSAGRYGPGTSFHIGRITLISNTGTYLDAPFHRYAGTADIADLPLASLANLDGLTVRPGTDRAIGRGVFEHLRVAGRAVLVDTGWSRHWGTEHYFSGHPFLAADAATFLAEAGAALVGIDSLNIDDTEDPLRPAHSILLRAGIPLVEHMCGLDTLPPDNFRFFAVPPPVHGLGSFPVRAFALVPE